jgi:hypothetical protein
MKTVLLLILTSASLFSIHVQAACENQTNPRVDRVLYLNEQNIKIENLWGEYNVSNMPFYIVDGLYDSRCAYLVKGTQILKRVTLSKPVERELSFYSFVVNSRMYPNYPSVGGMDVLKEEQRKGRMACCMNLTKGQAREMGRGLTEADELSATVYFFPKGSVEDYVIDLSYSTLVHESLHFQFQNRLGNSNPWPGGNPFDLVYGGQREEICYNPNKSVESILLKEAEALKYAYKLSSQGLDAGDLIREFIRLRKLRYSKVGSIKKSHGRLGIFSKCENHEATWEYIEGTANFVGRRVLVESGIYDRGWFVDNTISKLESNLKYGYSGLHYSMGKMQWRILLELLGQEEFIELTKEISTSSVRPPIYKLIEDALEL